MNEFDTKKILEENKKLKEENEKLTEYLDRLETKIVNSIENLSKTEYQNIDYKIDTKKQNNINLNQLQTNNELILNKSNTPPTNKFPNFNENEEILFENVNYSLNNDISKNYNIITNKIEEYTKEPEEFEDMSIISFLARSEKRVQILKSLTQHNKIPSIISKEIGDENHHISKHLKTLKEKGLIVCLNEDDKRFRFYSITSKGRKYLKKYENNY